jgi:hypothetical protein
MLAVYEPQLLSMELCYLGADVAFIEGTRLLEERLQLSDLKLEVILLKGKVSVTVAELCDLVRRTSMWLFSQCKPAPHLASD